LLEAKAGPEPWGQISESRLSKLAAQCGASELAEIHDRLNLLKVEPGQEVMAM